MVFVDCGDLLVAIGTSCGKPDRREDAGSIPKERGKMF